VPQHNPDCSQKVRFLCYTYQRHNGCEITNRKSVRHLDCGGSATNLSMKPASVAVIALLRSRISLPTSLSLPDTCFESRLSPDFFLSKICHGVVFISTS